MAVTAYLGMLAAKKEFEENLAKPVDIQAENKKMCEEDEMMLKNAEEIGDDDLINMAKQKIKTDENWVNAVIPKQLEENKKEIERAKEFIRKNTDIYKQDFEAVLPAYNSPNENDKV